MRNMIIAAVLALTVTNGYSSQKPFVIDDYTLDKIKTIIHDQVKPADKNNQGELINIISKQFLGTPYVANMLIGSPSIPEQLVVDFRGLDCFTYLDYVESLRKSSNVNGFIKNLIKTRYTNSQITYFKRKHFFTDWSHQEALIAKDMTAKMSNQAVTVTKYLNKKTDGSEFIPSLGIFIRDITYIPSQYVDDSVVKQLKTGDYIGIYTYTAGLDVTHTGIFVMTENGPMLRNASSRIANKKVVDSPFLEYVKETPGIIVMRAM